MSKHQEITFSDDDIVGREEWIPVGEYNPHNVRPWLLHDHGFCLAIVFASNEQDALDAAVDADKLDRYLIADEKELADDEYMEQCACLGNAGEMFDIESLGLIELPNVRLSFCQLFDAQL